MELIQKEMTELQYRVSTIEKTLENCCSSKSLVEKELAHKSLNEALIKLEKITNKLLDIEEAQRSHPDIVADLKRLKQDSFRLKMGIATIVGIGMAIKFLGFSSHIAEVVKG